MLKNKKTKKRYRQKIYINLGLNIRKMDNLLYYVKEFGILTIICDYVCDKKLDKYVNNLKLLKYLWEQYTAKAISEEKFKEIFNKLISNINEYRKYRSEYKNRGGSYPQKNTTPIPKLPYHVKTHPTRGLGDLRFWDHMFDMFDMIDILYTPPYGRLHGGGTIPFFGGGYTTWWGDCNKKFNGDMSVILSAFEDSSIFIIGTTSNKVFS